MRRYLARALGVCLALSLLAVLHAQNSGRLTGKIVDASGAAMPGVTVEITAAGFSRVVVTDGRGQFEFTNVPAGLYTVTATLAGFRPARLEAVRVAANDTRTLAMTMRVGALEESVTISGAAPVRAGGGFGLAGAMAGSFVRRQPFNTEAYDKIDDNTWQDAGRTPLSTFSIDVDTASYSNVRRFLSGGQLPPKDAVRIEEMINYFSYQYPAPDGDKPFSVTTAMAPCPWNAHHALALIGLQAKRIDSEHMPPRNLVFLIDVSGSMFTPAKLPLVKASLAMLARNLTARDRVAIVVYAGNTGLVLPSTSGANTPAILEALAGLEAGGSTNGGAGIQLAYKTAEEHFILGGVNRVILATDGDFNVGVTNQGDLIRLIEEKREGGVTLSVLGFGMGNLKDSTMEKLADRGNGNYSYIDSLAEAEKVLVHEVGGTLVTVAKDVKLQVEFNPRAVKSYRLVGYEKRLLADRDFNDDRKDAGDMGAGQSVTALYELVPAGEMGPDDGTIDPLKYQTPRAASAAGARDEAMTIKLRYKQPDGQSSSVFSVVVGNRQRATPELEFAASVAEFGMLLRDSEFKGTSTFDDVRARASRNKAPDPYGHRAEFVAMVDAAERLARGEQHVR